MKLAFAISGLLALAMCIIAQLTLRQPFGPNIIHLRWATDSNPARNAQIALFDQENPDIKVTVDESSGTDMSKVIVECATGTGPDVIDVRALQTLVEAGVLVDLTPYASNMGFDPAHTFPSIKDDITLGGKQYDFPCNVNADAIIFNKKIFDDHGIPYPKPGWTMDDFRRTAKLILTTPSKSGQKHLAVANWWGTEFFQDLLFDYGGRMYSPDGLHSELDSPASVAAMQQYHDMMYVDHIIQTPAESAGMSSQGGWGAGGLDWFSGGKAAMIVIGRWWTVQLPDYPELQGVLGAVPFPRVDGAPSCVPASTRAAGVNIETPHRAAALRFLQYLASPGYGKLIVGDGDGLPPDPQLAQTGAALVPPMGPDASFQQAFIDSVRTGRSPDLSPYIDDSDVQRWLNDTVQLVENRLETPRQALHGLANQIDENIQSDIRQRPDLQKLYRERQSDR